MVASSFPFRILPAKAGVRVLSAKAGVRVLSAEARTGIYLQIIVETRFCGGDNTSSLIRQRLDGWRIDTEVDEKLLKHNRPIRAAHPDNDKDLN